MNQRFFIFLLIFGMSGALFVSASGAELAQSSPEGMRSNLVCMVNDQFMGKEQIPVPFEGKTYYGCCKGCVLNLQNNRSLRYAKDPYTGAEVDKAHAFIASKPGSDEGEVFYFQSRENHEAYLKSLGSENITALNSKKG